MPNTIEVPDDMQPSDSHPDDYEDIVIPIDSIMPFDMVINPDVADIAPEGMVYVPSGPFWMGCAPATGVECQADEMPMHAVSLPGFFIDRSETTQAAYQECVNVRACIEPSCSWTPKESPDKPVVCVSWDQARGFCNWMQKRLPTEAEWEKAARGTDKRLYPWGDAYPDCYHAVINDDGPSCSGRISKNICSRSPLGDSPYGACDMLGNVWEWVSDWYAEDYFSRGVLQNPQGPSTGSEKVCRGGGYANKPDQIMVFERTPVDPLVAGDYFLGFRCAMSQ